MIIFISYGGLVNSVNEIRKNIIQMGGRNKRSNGAGVRNTVFFVIGGFFLCWTPTILFQFTRVTGLREVIVDMDD